MVTLTNHPLSCSGNVNDVCMPTRSKPITAILTCPRRTKRHHGKGTRWIRSFRMTEKSIALMHSERLSIAMLHRMTYKRLFLGGQKNDRIPGGNEETLYYTEPLDSVARLRDIRRRNEPAISFPGNRSETGRTSPVTEAHSELGIDLPQFLQGAKLALSMVPRPMAQVQRLGRDQCAANHARCSRQPQSVACRPTHGPSGHSSRGPTQWRQSPVSTQTCV